MTMTSLLMFAGALLVAAGSPGPSVAALVARVLSKGARDVLPFLVALWIGEAIWLSFAVAGLAAIAESFHLLFVAIKWLGVAYLLYLAWKMWMAEPDLPGDSLPQSRSPSKLFFAGLTVTLGNPKVMMFYVALLPSIIDLRSVDLDRLDGAGCDDAGGSGRGRFRLGDHGRQCAQAPEEQARRSPRQPRQRRNHRRGGRRHRHPLSRASMRP